MFRHYETVAESILSETEQREKKDDKREIEKMTKDSR